METGQSYNLSISAQFQLFQYNRKKNQQRNKTKQLQALNTSFCQLNQLYNLFYPHINQQMLQGFYNFINSINTMSQDSQQPCLKNIVEEQEEETLFLLRRKNPIQKFPLLPALHFIELDQDHFQNYYDRFLEELNWILEPVQPNQLNVDSFQQLSKSSKNQNRNEVRPIGPVPLTIFDALGQVGQQKQNKNEPQLKKSSGIFQDISIFLQLDQKQYSAQEYLQKQSAQDQENQEQVLDTQQHKKTKKRDDKRNLPGNIFKHALKAYKEPCNSQTVNKIHRICGITNSASAIEYFSKKRNLTFPLVRIYEQLDLQVGNDDERAYKKAFLIFYRWLMRCKYPIHILREPKIINNNKVDYLRHKNIMVYLPELKEKKKKALNQRKTVAQFSQGVENESQVQSKSQEKLESARISSTPIF